MAMKLKIMENEKHTLLDVQVPTRKLKNVENETRTL
ncbi:hypothetical protein T09_2480 [Trichinella sp. T9]|nr:hypothetical protein T09_2480 [Trichinella sp. T9]